jgi:HTH-type transcriptional regulator / antitoxin HigA
MQPKVIRTEADHAAALSRIGDLMSAQAGTPEGEELDLLTALVELYEEQTCAIPPPDPVAAIRFRMSQLDLTPHDLVPYLGKLTKVKEVLAGQRALTLPMIRRLIQGLGIPAESLLLPMRQTSRSRKALAKH